MLNRRKLLKVGAAVTSSSLVGKAAQADGNAVRVFPPGSLDRRAFEYHYRLFSDICHLCPMPIQDETLAVAESIWQLINSWRKDAPSVEEYLTTTRKTVSHLESLKRLIPVIEIKDGKTIPPQQPLECTATLPRLVLLNRGGKPLEPLTIVTSIGQTSVEIGVAAAERLSIPVQVREPVKIHGKILDSDLKTAWPGKVYALGSDGIYRHGVAYSANATVSEKPIVFRPAWRKLPFFYSDGSFEILMPPGKVQFVLERGYEHEITTRDWDCPPGVTQQVVLSSGRMIDLKTHGWISGDTHVHWSTNSWDENESPGLLKVVQRAEDVRVVNNLTLYQWRKEKPFTKPDNAPPGLVKELSDGDYLVQMGEEFRNDNHYGHINLLGIKKLVTPISTGPGSGGDAQALDWPLNKVIIEEARRQGAVVCEAHNLGPFNASSVPVHLAMGLSDCLDQLEPQHYYRFLDCGFRIGLGNGSDHPARLLGCCRVYVKTSGPLSHQNWIEGLKAGRSFTTSGPILLFQVDGQDPGSVLNRKPGDQVHIRLRAMSRHPLGKVEIVGRGAKILKSVVSKERDITIDLDHRLEESIWLTARVSIGNQFDALSGPDIAHTSAIYVEIPGKPVFDPDAARWWIANLGNHRERLRLQGNFPDTGKKNEALAFIDEGIRIYETMIQKGTTR